LKVYSFGFEKVFNHVGCFGDVAGWVFAFGLGKLATEFGQFFGTMLKNLVDFGAEFFQIGSSSMILVLFVCLANV
jgi:hypothetical protein